MDVFDDLNPEQIKEEFYRMAVVDLNNGATIGDLEEIIKAYQDSEMYMACAGIKKALDEVKSLRYLLGDAMNFMDDMKLTEFKENKNDK